MSNEDSSLRIIVFGQSGHHQYSLTESILQRAVFTGADPSTELTTKTTGSVFQRNVTLVNTPNLKDHALSHYTIKKELKKAVCFSCPGPHAVLFTLNPFDVPADAHAAFKPLVRYFGKHILKNTMVVLYHEEEQGRKFTKHSVMKNRPLRELLEKCGQRYIIFGRQENMSEGKVTENLFREIDRMVEDHGIFSNVEFNDAEKRIRKEEIILQNKRKEGVSAVLEELRKTRSQEDWEREARRYNEKIRLENRERAELLVADRLGFTLRLVDYSAAVGKGALAGALLLVPMGFQAMAIGAAGGAVFGGLLGDAVGAVWNYITDAMAEGRLSG